MSGGDIRIHEDTRGICRITLLQPDRDGQLASLYRYAKHMDNPLGGVSLDVELKAKPLPRNFAPWH